MRALTFCLLCCAAAAFGYEGTTFQAFVELGYKKIDLVKEGSAEKSRCLWYSGPRLDGNWKELSFVFTPQDDGTVCLRFGPQGAGDIPFYYDDVRVNGVPVDAKAWVFWPSAQEGSQLGTLSGSCLKLYGTPSTYCFAKVKKGERTEVAMRARCGSFLETCANRLAPVTDDLAEAMKCGAAPESAVKELAESLDALLALSAAKLHVSVPPLGSVVSLESLRAKTLELAKAYEAEKANEVRPCLYDQPKTRVEVRAATMRASQASARLKTACLLAFMLGAP